MFRAIYRGTAVGAALCFIQKDVAYGHLMGINGVGHELGVSYALYWSHLPYLSDRVRWLDWGGTSGVQNRDGDGLSQFKRGWSTGTRTAYFCGKVINQERYTAVMEARGQTQDELLSSIPEWRNGIMRPADLHMGSILQFLRHGFNPHTRR